MPFKEWDVERWIQELETGLEYRRRYARENHWRDNEALFYNVAEGQDRAGPNIVMSSADAMLSNTVLPYPYYTVESDDFQGEEGSAVVERIDNKFVDKLKMPREVFQAAVGTFLYGTGFVKLGYDSEWGWDPRFEVAQAGMTGSQFDKRGARLEFGPGKPGMPWVAAVTAHDIVVPWGTLHLDNCPWIAHRVVRHVDLLRADPKYTTRGLEPSMSMQDFMLSYQAVMKAYRLGESVRGGRLGTPQEIEYVELWEIHDKRTGKVLVLAANHDTFLRNEPDLLQLNGLPFVEMGFVPAVRSIWRTPDASYIRAHQLELNDLTIQATMQRRLAGLKFLIAEDAMDGAEWERLFSNKIGIAARVKAGFDLDKVIKAIQPTQNPQIYMEAEQIKNAAQETLGISTNQRGEFAGSRTSATEVGVVEKRATMRQNRRQTAVQNVYVDLIEKINPIIFSFWTTPQVIDVIGPEGLLTWKRFVGPQLRGAYTYSVSLTEDPPLSPRERASWALSVSQMFAQDPTVDPLALRSFIANAVNRPTFSRIFKPGVLTGDPRAALRTGMPQVPSSGRGGQTNQGSQSTPQMPQM